MRFHASRRLKKHTKFSTAIVIAVSLTLILTSLLQAYDLGQNINSKYVPLIQVFSSITVLVYTLLIDKNDFSSLSEKMYSCASRLGELKQKIYPYITTGNTEKYHEFQEKYGSILKVYETAQINDFRADYFKAQLDMPENYPFGKIDRILLKLKIYFLYIYDFSQYILITLVMIFLIFWIVFGFNHFQK